MLVTNLQCVRKLAAGGDVGSMSLNGLVPLINTDTVQFRLSTDSNATTAEMQAYSFTLERIAR